MVLDNVPLLQCFVKKDGRVSYNVATYTLAVIIMVTIELLAESNSATVHVHAGQKAMYLLTVI